MIEIAVHDTTITKIKSDWDHSVLGHWTPPGYPLSDNFPLMLATSCVKSQLARQILQPIIWFHKAS
jgi:hypothetical protein